MEDQLTAAFIRTLLKPRDKFSHKGNYGHALLVAGSHGKIGAAILAVTACLRSGIGLLTVHLPKCGYEIMQGTNPEAMVQTDNGEKLIEDQIMTKPFSAVGVGPGMDTDTITQKALHYILTENEKPLVLDADALNSISLNKSWLDLIPANSILTPHPKEFERLAGETENDIVKHELQISFSKKYKLFIVLKGANTCITTPSGESYFNTTGNPGMAKGGSGDVLTGIITGLLAQGYSSLEASLIGVFVHGLAGDLTADALGETGMTSGDICKYLPLAFKQLYLPTN
ncbi:MAG: NAD(P)H-hydrate dehydratase [Sediminibacterium sp.]